jgi:hypothetical protein
VELLESISLPLLNEELAELDNRTHKEAQEDHDDKSVISEENTVKLRSIVHGCIIFPDPFFNFCGS